MTRSLNQRPALVVHADWSTNPRKRWQAQARLRADGRSGKRIPCSRAANTQRLLAWAEHNDVAVSAEVEAEIANGFGVSADGEDRFDAVVGLIGMLNILFGHRPSGDPADDSIQRIEGWILGQIGER